MLKTFYSYLNYPSIVFFVCFKYLKSLNSHVFVYNLAFKFLAIFFVPHTCANVFRCVVSGSSKNILYNVHASFEFHVITTQDIFSILDVNYENSLKYKGKYDFISCW
jgi:hypothetical protein